MVRDLIEHPPVNIASSTPAWFVRGREVPSWDDYFLAIAKTASLRSRDPDTQVGACVADTSTHHLVATGCNGPPPGIVGDDELNWSRPEKYRHTIHAECNALLHATRQDLSDCTLYVTGKPCSRCMLMIAAKRIKRVVYSPLLIRMVDEAEWATSLDIARMCRISLEESRQP